MIAVAATAMTAAMIQNGARFTAAAPSSTLMANPRKLSERTIRDLRITQEAGHEPRDEPFVVHGSPFHLSVKGTLELQQHRPWSRGQGQVRSRRTDWRASSAAVAAAMALPAFRSAVWAAR